MSSTAPGRTRLTRAESKALTRQRLLEAAGELVAAKGFAATSIEEIAEAAGYTIGAIYSNFGSKEALILALLEEHMSASMAELAQVFDEADGEQRTGGEALGRYFERLAAAHERWWLLSNEVWLYALRHPEARARLVRPLEVCDQSIARLVERLFADQGLESPMPPGQLAVVIDGLADGMLKRRRLGQENITGETFRTALDWLLRGALEAAAKRRESGADRRGA
jgi:AcrR family transcriptional regulator